MNLADRMPMNSFLIKEGIPFLTLPHDADIGFCALRTRATCVFNVAKVALGLVAGLILTPAFLVYGSYQLLRHRSPLRLLDSLLVPITLTVVAVVWIIRYLAAAILHPKSAPRPPQPAALGAARPPLPRGPDGFPLTEAVAEQAVRDNDIKLKNNNQDGAVFLAKLVTDLPRRERARMITAIKEVDPEVFAGEIQLLVLQKAVTLPRDQLPYFLRKSWAVGENQAHVDLENLKHNNDLLDGIKTQMMRDADFNTAVELVGVLLTTEWDQFAEKFFR